MTTAPPTIVEKDAIDAAYRDANKGWDWLCARIGCDYTQHVGGAELRVCCMCGKPNPKWLRMRVATTQLGLFGDGVPTALPHRTGK